MTIAEGRLEVGYIQLGVDASRSLCPQRKSTHQGEREESSQECVARSSVLNSCE